MSLRNIVVACWLPVAWAAAEDVSLLQTQAALLQLGEAGAPHVGAFFPNGGRANPLLIGAGQGTTGTHGVHAAFCQLGLKAIHFNLICNMEGHERWAALVAHRRIRDLFLNIGHLRPEPWAKKVRDALNDLLSTGVEAVADSPYPKMLSLMLKVVPDARVVLSTRDALGWAAQRRVLHNHGHVCSRELWPQVANPMDMYDCKKQQNQVNGDAFHVISQISDDELAQSFNGYNQYVRSAVPAKRLVEIDFFSYPDTAAGHAKAINALVAKVKSRFSVVPGMHESTQNSASLRRGADLTWDELDAMDGDDELL